TEPEGPGRAFLPVGWRLRCLNVVKETVTTIVKERVDRQESHRCRDGLLSLPWRWGSGSPFRRELTTRRIAPAARWRPASAKRTMAMPYRRSCLDPCTRP